MRDNYITRNECLNLPYEKKITRLAIYINTLRQEGWEFETKEINGDYIYRAIKSPFKSVTYTLSNGEQITRKENK